jgi:hypothetical protein
MNLRYTRFDVCMLVEMQAPTVIVRPAKLANASMNPE